MVLCSCGYSKKMHTKLSFAGYDKNQIVNVLLLSVSHSLSFSVQLGKLLFPFIFFFFSWRSVSQVLCWLSIV